MLYIDIRWNQWELITRKWNYWNNLTYVLSTVQAYSCECGLLSFLIISSQTYDPRIFLFQALESSYGI